MADNSNNFPHQPSNGTQNAFNQPANQSPSFQELYNQYVTPQNSVQPSATSPLSAVQNTQPPAPTPAPNHIPSQTTPQSSNLSSHQIVMPESVVNSAQNTTLNSNAGQTNTANNQSFESTLDAGSLNNSQTSNAADSTSSQKSKNDKTASKFQTKNKNHSTPAIFLSTILSVLITFALVIVASNFGLLQLPGQSSGLTSVSKLEEERANAALTLSKDAAPNWEKIFATVVPSSVSIEVALPGSQGSSLGSGFVTDKSGLVVTNNHVVSGGEDGQITVTLYGNRVFEAKIKGTDPTADLAVLQIQNPPQDLQPVQFADSDGLIVGQPVLAVGNPLGLFDTATQGIVSALDRPVVATDKSAASQLVVTNAIQIDAAINPGNSGGALYDITGKLIGVPSSIAQVSSASSSTSGSIGLGFAIPSNLVQSITKQIIDSGAAKHAALGVTIQDATTVIDGVHRRAPRIETVGDDSPASKAGLKKDDCIISVDGKSTTSTYSLMGFIRAKEFGSTAKIAFVRDGKQQEVEVKLDKEQQLPAQSEDDGETQMFDPFAPQK